MTTYLRAEVLDRDSLSTGLADVSRLNLVPSSISQLISRKIPPRGAIVVTWQRENHDPYPEALIVQDNDYQDTLAWLGSYFNGLAPITQWCRIWPQSAIERLERHRPEPSVGEALGSWIGTIIAEIAVQGGGNVNLREVPGSAAMTSATFAAARAISVWDRDAPLRDVALRHDELSSRLREGARPISANRLLPIWYTLTDDRMWAGAEGERRGLEPFALLLKDIWARKSVGDELVQSAVQEARDHFDLPILVECARGPQLERVKALDELVARVSAGPQTTAVNALVGFAASLVEPGAAVLPELLKKYPASLSLAPVWLGAFAGAWSTARILADHQGLGRMISKAVLGELDLEGRPICDIAYPELVRWLGGGVGRVTLRGMALRTINVEILAGVTAPFAYGRADASRPDVGHAVPGAFARVTTPTSGIQNSAQMQRTLADLKRRIERLESRNPITDQPDLLSPDDQSGAGPTGKKGSRVRR